MEKLHRETEGLSAFECDYGKDNFPSVWRSVRIGMLGWLNSLNILVCTGRKFSIAKKQLDRKDVLYSILGEPIL